MKKTKQSFTLMEIILAFFILAGTITFLLVARQQSIEQSVSQQEKRKYYLELRSSLDQAAASIEMPGLEFEANEKILVEASELDIDGISMRQIRVSMEMPVGPPLVLERWVRF